MSETVHYNGDLVLKFVLKDETLFEELCEKICKNNGCEEELSVYYSTWEEQLSEELYEKYIIIRDNGEIYMYEILNMIEIEENEMFNIKKKDNCHYEYDVIYNNDNMWLREAIEKSLLRSK
jgi:hypothetical protein